MIMGLVAYFTQNKGFKSKNQFSEPCTASFTAAQLIMSRLQVQIPAKTMGPGPYQAKNSKNSENVQVGTGPILFYTIEPVP